MTINREGTILEEDIDKADCLNDHFGTVGARMAKEYDDYNNGRTYQDPLSLIKKERNNNSMVLFPTDEYELANMISKLDNKKSCGYDLLNNSIY